MPERRQTRPPVSRPSGGALSTLTQTYDVLTESVGEDTALGLVAAIGLVGLALVAVPRMLRPGRRAGGRMVVVGVLVLFTLAWFTRGGLGSLFALTITPQIRTWSRLSV